MTEAELKRFAERNLEGRFPENDLAAAVLALLAERDEARKQASVAKGASNYEAKRAEAAEARVHELEVILRAAMEGHNTWRDHARAALAAGKEGP